MLYKPGDGNLQQQGHPLILKFSLGTQTWQVYREPGALYSELSSISQNSLWSTSRLPCMYLLTFQSQHSLPGGWARSWGFQAALGLSGHCPSCSPHRGAPSPWNQTGVHNLSLLWRKQEDTGQLSTGQHRLRDTCLVSAWLDNMRK